MPAAILKVYEVAARGVTVPIDAAALVEGSPAATGIDLMITVASRGPWITRSYVVVELEAVELEVVELEAVARPVDVVVERVAAGKG